MSSTIALGIAVMGFLALLVAVGVLLQVLRKSGVRSGAVPPMADRQAGVGPGQPRALSAPEAAAVPAPGQRAGASTAELSAAPLSASPTADVEAAGARAEGPQAGAQEVDPRVADGQGAVASAEARTAAEAPPASPGLSQPGLSHPGSSHSGTPSPDASSPPATTPGAPVGSVRQGADLGPAAHAAHLAGMSPELAAEAQRRLAEAGRAAEEAQQRLAEASRAAEELRASAESDAAAIVRRAEEAAEGIASAQRNAEQRLQSAQDEAAQLRRDLERREARLAEREGRLDEESRRLEQRAAALEDARQEIHQQRAELSRLAEERREVLERAAGLTAEQAKAELVAAIENQAKREAALLVRDTESQARRDADTRARRIVTLAIQRVASEQTSESVVSVLHLPSDEMKGRIIGREGRNIRAFESVTGVNLIIDDTPEAVLLSCFDPVRREVGRLALERLVLDGRIHPQRIEEAYERSKAEVEQRCAQAGEDAMVELGITDMHPELVTLLGQLRYRTSYGQNVLGHLVESAHLAGMMAGELGLDVPLLKRCTVLHDVGKALSHEVEGSHAMIGAEIARRYGEPSDVVHAIEAHHNEVEVRTVEAVLTQAADAISGSRPGARRESLEAYVKRLERLEQIATAHQGVEKVFAMQAGREIRVMVKPDAVDDIQAQVIAHDVAKQVEEELTYPGQIRVTVVRESRAIEFAR